MKPTYESPLASRYASKTMLHLFSPDMRYETWRRLWVALARAEHTLGLPVTQQQVAPQRPARLQRQEAQAVRKSLPWHRPVTGIPSCR